MNNKIILLTGEPVMGKSTAIKKLISLIGASNLAGFYTEEFRENGSRIGFLINTLDGKQGILASITSDSDLRIERYGVHIDVFENLCLPCILDGMKSGKVLIIDEIGPMQMYSDKFKELLLNLLDNKYPTIGTVFYHSHPWIDKLKTRGNIELIELTTENRDHVPEELFQRYSQKKALNQTRSYIL